MHCVVCVTCMLCSPPSNIADACLPNHLNTQVWNGMFSQTQYALDQGVALKLDPDRYTAMAKFYSRRAQQASKGRRTVLRAV